MNKSMTSADMNREMPLDGGSERGAGKERGDAACPTFICVYRLCDRGEEGKGDMAFL